MKIKKIVPSLVLSGMVITSLPYNAFASETVNKQIQTYVAQGNLSQPGYDLVGIDSLVAKGYTGKGVKIAVLDTGIASHSDLMIAGGVSTVDYTTSYQDDHGHGTHVAGIIGGKDNNTGITGIAPAAELYAVKVMNQNSEAFNADVIEGIRWAIDHDMDIINMSIGLNNENEEMKEILDEAYSKGILIVASAGNYGNVEATGDNVLYPAKYDSVIAVGAVNDSKIRWSNSATGSKVEVVAPGVNIYSTFLNNQFAKASGTSQAAPFVAGLLALYKEAYPELSNVEIRSLLQQNTEDLGIVGRDNEYGYGLVKIPSLPNQTVETPSENEEEASTEPNEDEVEVKEPSTFTLEFSQESYQVGDLLEINGVATDENGNPLANADVRLNIRGGEKFYLYSVKTDTNGEYHFSLDLSQLRFTAANYVVEATLSHESYEAQQIGSFDIGESQPEITIFQESNQVTSGENLTASATVLDENGNPYNGYITVILRNEQGKEVRKNYYLIKNGVYTYNFSTRTLSTGIYTLEVAPRYIDGVSSSVSFTVSPR